MNTLDVPLRLSRKDGEGWTALVRTQEDGGDGTVHWYTVWVRLMPDAGGFHAEVCRNKVLIYNAEHLSRVEATNAAQSAIERSMTLRGEWEVEA